jgi:hypothetical protein
VSTRSTSGHEADDPEHRRQRCYFLLSIKSSGSSVIQRQIAEMSDARLVEHTNHEENETMFFTKAASILGLPQYSLENSVVPYSARKARAEMRRLLVANLPGWNGQLNSEQDIFAAWTALVRSHPEDLVEKSPHHLYQPSVIALMERYADATPEIDCRFIGLIRNPIATLYSSWRRFGVRPEREEVHWTRAYSNLLDFAERRPDLVTIVRYKDLVTGETDLASVLGIKRRREPDEKLHSGALDKWLKDPGFGYTPSRETIAVAERYGFAPDELENPNAGSWALRREPRALFFHLFFSLPPSTQLAAKSLIKQVAGR